MDEINRAYNKLKYESRNDYPKLRTLEAAHDALVMVSFNKRVQVLPACLPHLRPAAANLPPVIFQLTADLIGS